jgi:ATP-dependent Lhr-like helicase
MTAGASTAFHLLDERIQRFIWSHGWASLREVQERSIPPVLKADRDVIITAATASGKTEAAFLPALTHLLQKPSGLIVYVSPLKALINDQFGRMSELCESLELPVWPWHGDVSATTKTRFLARRQGVLLITPESLEALLCNRGSSIAAVFENTTYFVVDELHAFIGSERGKQLQSLMHRIEHAIGHTVVRLGLSATLGDMLLAADFLRPGKADRVEIIQSLSEGGDLRVLVKGYVEPLVVRPSERSGTEENADECEVEPITPAQIAANLFKVLRGSNNLVFPNSRREVERYTHLLNQMCTDQNVRNEFWPHHGSLSKEIRAETELALKQKERPASAICTNTLELGIDIGSVKCVAQIGPAPSVASLRQRLGRSGRREGEPAILRGYCVEDAVDSRSPLDTVLRLRTVQMVAMVELLIESWFEPPMAHGLHLSTLVQQILSVIAQNGGAMIGQLYELLCSSGSPFNGLTKEDFAALLLHLGGKGLLMQDSSGVLLHGPQGEKFVNHYSFYAAFAADEEFRIVAGARTLGTLPVSQMLSAGQRILFAGKTWRVDEVDDETKTIYVTRASGGVPPIFNGGNGRTHTQVRVRMRQLLQSEAMPAFLDPVASQFLQEGRRAYADRKLAAGVMLDQGRELMILTWLGDAANEALACLLRAHGMQAVAAGPGVEVQKKHRSVDAIVNVLAEVGGGAPPSLDAMLADVGNIQREKWDWALSDGLLRKAYASLYLNLDEALAWIATLKG